MSQSECPRLVVVSHFLSSSPLFFHCLPNGYCNLFGQTQSLSPSLFLKGVDGLLKTEHAQQREACVTKVAVLHMHTYVRTEHTHGGRRMNSPSAVNRVIRGVSRGARKFSLTYLSLIYI